jgi:hypothetical protein
MNPTCLIRLDRLRVHGQYAWADGTDFATSITGVVSNYYLGTYLPNC